MMKTLNERLNKMINRLDNILQASEQQYSSGLAGIQEADSRNMQRQGVSKDGVTRNTPQYGTHTLPPRPDGEQQSTGLQEEEQGQEPASRPDDCIEEGSNPGGESIRGGLVHDTAPSNPFDTKTSSLVQTPRIGQPETNLYTS